MPEPVFTFPTSAAGWYALVVFIITGLTPIITAQLIRRRPDLSEKWRRRWSAFIPVILAAVLGWPFMVWMGYATWDVASLSIMVGGGFSAAGGAKIVYNEALDFWHDLSTPTAASRSDEQDPRVDKILEAKLEDTKK